MLSVLSSTYHLCNSAQWSENLTKKIELMLIWHSGLNVNQKRNRKKEKKPKQNKERKKERNKQMNRCLSCCCFFQFVTIHHKLPIKSASFFWTKYHLIYQTIKKARGFLHSLVVRDLNITICYKNLLLSFVFAFDILIKTLMLTLRAVRGGQSQLYFAFAAYLCTLNPNTTLTCNFYEQYIKPFVSCDYQVILFHYYCYYQTYSCQVAFEW